jgi:hypothetical protein
VRRSTVHALIATVSIDPSGMEGAREHLQSRVVPAVKQAPGLVAGYWLAPKEGSGALEGYSVILFDDEESAQKAQEMAKQSPLAPGVQFTGFEIREVVAHT